MASSYYPTKLQLYLDASTGGNSTSMVLTSGGSGLPSLMTLSGTATGSGGSFQQTDTKIVLDGSTVFVGSNLSKTLNGRLADLEAISHSTYATKTNVNTQVGTIVTEINSLRSRIFASESILANGLNGPTPGTSSGFTVTELS